MILFFLFNLVWELLLIFAFIESLKPYMFRYIFRIFAVIQCQKFGTMFCDIVHDLNTLWITISGKKLVLIESNGWDSVYVISSIHRNQYLKWFTVDTNISEITECVRGPLFVPFLFLLRSCCSYNSSICLIKLWYPNMECMCIV